MILSKVLSLVYEDFKINFSKISLKVLNNYIIKQYIIIIDDLYFFMYCANIKSKISLVLLIHKTLACFYSLIREGEP